MGEEGNFLKRVLRQVIKGGVEEAGERAGRAGPRTTDEVSEVLEGRKVP